MTITPLTIYSAEVSVQSLVLIFCRKSFFLNMCYLTREVCEILHTGFVFLSQNIKNKIHCVFELLLVLKLLCKLEMIFPSIIKNKSLTLIYNHCHHLGFILLSMYSLFVCVCTIIMIIIWNMYYFDYMLCQRRCT